MIFESDTGRIWNSVSKKLYSFILTKVRSEEEAKDILQEVYIKIHNNLASLKNNESLTSWIFMITRNQVNDWFREKQKTLKEVHEIPVYNEPDRGKYMTEAIADMIKMMDNLPPDYCEALCMTELEGYSQKEYAAKTRISYSAAKSRVQRGRAMLKDMMMKCCHYQFDRYGTVFEIHPSHCCCCGKS